MRLVRGVSIAAIATVAAIVSVTSTAPVGGGTHHAVAHTVFDGTAVAPADASALTTRDAGSDRYGTATAISSQYAPGVPAVYIATGTTFPDALAAGAAAGATSPVLLVAGGTVPASVVTEVQRLAPAKVILVGGPSAVPDSVGVQLGGYAAGGWTRLSGADRFATAAAISAATFRPGVPDVYVATGANFPDALTAAALGAYNGGPVLLTQTNDLPATTRDELQRLQPAHIVVMGGTNAVSDAVYTALGAYSSSVVRAQGATRYDTNVIANAGVVAQSPATLIVATGANFPDALAGAALAGHLHTAMLLVGAGALDQQQQHFIASFAPKSLIVLGSTSAVANTTVSNVLVAAGLQAPTSTPQAGDYALNTYDGQTVRWNPCATIGWKLDAPGASPATIGLLTSGVADLAAASGLNFRYDGTTSFVPTQQNVTAEPDGLIVAWLPKASTDLFDGMGAADGIGGVAWEENSAHVVQVVNGYAYLDAGAVGGFSDHIKTDLILHELGHAVGLMHAASAAEIMYPVVSDQTPADYSAGDRAGLARVGAAAGCIS